LGYFSLLFVANGLITGHRSPGKAIIEQTHSIFELLNSRLSQEYSDAADLIFTERGLLTGAN